jgi:hypothetical protein
MDLPTRRFAVAGLSCSTSSRPPSRCMLEPIGYVPPVEYEARYYEQAKVA